MASQQVIVFHHVLGLTRGVTSFADRLRSEGHIVTTPDAFDGCTFSTVEAGVAHASSIGFDDLTDRGVALADAIAGRFVVIGFSLGVLPAQRLAQTHSHVSAAVLLHGAIPPAAFGVGVWPGGVPLQIHISPDDPLVEEDLEAVRELADVPGAELFEYDGSGHLIADETSGDFAANSFELIVERVIALLARLP